MKQIQLGSTELLVSPIGFGCSRIGGMSAAGPRRHGSTRLLHEALDGGINFFDTADAYADGDSERLLGEAFRGKRDRVVIATKVGYSFSEENVTASRLQPVFGIARRVQQRLGSRILGRPGRFQRQDFSRAYLRRAVDASLRRLQTDYIDVYQLHAPRTQQAHDPEVIDTLKQLQTAGKIRYFGVGLEGLEDVESWLHQDALSTVQLPFGLLDLDAGDTLLGRIDARKLGVIARGVFGGGLLKPGLAPERLRELTPKWARIQRFHEIAKSAGRPIHELALHYVLQKPGVGMVLLGMHQSSQLSANLRCAAQAPLDQATLTALEAVNDQVSLEA